MVRLLGNRVLVKEIINDYEITESGLYIEAKDETKVRFGEVVQLGENCDKRMIPIGSVVVFGKHITTKVNYGEFDSAYKGEYYIVMDSDVLSVIEK